MQKTIGHCFLKQYAIVSIALLFFDNFRGATRFFLGGRAKWFRGWHPPAPPVAESLGFPLKLLDTS